jgi:hypothetical protein
MGFQNILAASVSSVASDTMVVEFDGSGARVEVATSEPAGVGEPVLVAFRAGHAQVSLAGGTPGAISGRIRSTVYLGGHLRVIVDTGGGVIRAQIDERDFTRFGPDDLVQGRDVSVVVSPSHLVALPSADDPAHTEPLTSTMTSRVPT